MKYGYLYFLATLYSGENSGENSFKQDCLTENYMLYFCFGEPKEQRRLTLQTVKSGDTWYARAYLVYTLHGTNSTMYGNQAVLKLNEGKATKGGEYNGKI